MIWNGLVLLAILKLEKRFQKTGLVFFSYLALYSLGRFLLTFLRQESLIVGGLQQAQLVAILAMAASAFVALYLFARQRAAGEVAQK